MTTTIKRSIATPSSHHIRRLATATTLIATLAGCGLEGEQQGDPDDALSLAEPAAGKATIPTIYGEREVTYAIIDGHAIFEGDIDLGTVDENGDLIRLRNSVVDSSALLWPGGVIPFQIDPGFANPSRVGDAIALIEAQTSIRFRARTVNDTDFINFTTSTTSGVSFSPVGRVGGQQNVRIWTSHSANTIVHEVLHSLGLFHEQTRSDRDDFIELHEECIIDDWEYAFEPDPNSVDLEPYDVNSIMHYGPTNFCERDGGSCICPTMTLLDGVTPVTGSLGTLSDNDINTLYRLYNNALGVEEAADRFGQAVAAGDFDNDGYQDLAVGSPYEEIGSIMSGAVLVYKGNAAGKLAPWMLLTQSASGLGADEEGDEFGMALAVGDFDNDGFDDLAVGAPAEEIGVIDAGAVFLFEGSATGLSGWQQINQATAPALGINESGDHFGAALAAADFNLDGKDDLAIGAPEEDADPIQKNGWVFVYKGASTGVTPWESFGQGDIETDEANDEFGYALAVGRLNNDAYPDLVIGSPEWGQGSGSVFVFTGSVNGPVAFDQLRQSDVGGANEEDDYFGLSLAVADFSGDGRDDLAVGAPGEDVGAGNTIIDAGQVYMFKPVNNTINGWHNFGQSGLGADEAGDYFGSSLAAGEVWNSGAGNEDDLAVGAPGEDIESASVTNAGAAFVYSGGSANMVGRSVIIEDDLIKQSASTDTPASESHDEFGRRVCIGDFDGDGDGDLIVGVPLEDNDSGGIVYFPNFNNTNAFTYVWPLQQSFEQVLW
jgi:Astacin (Peptidase family M12A)/FG-GAP repeat